MRAKEIWGDKVFTTRDYSEVLARPDVDAVIIATPDHWHAPIAVDALTPARTSTVEKPMVQSLGGGPRGSSKRRRRSGKVVQVGSQRVSSIVYHKAKELLDAGAIGELNMVEAWWNRNSAIGAWQYSIPPDASPATVDWDRFLGRAPKRPFEPIRLFRWRNYRDYGTGVAGDLFVHLFSGIHFDHRLARARRASWHRRPALLERRPRRAGRHAGPLRLPEDGAASGVQPRPPRQLRGRRAATSSGLPVRRQRRRHDHRRSGVTLSKNAAARRARLHDRHLPEGVQEQFLKEYRAKYPDAAPQLQPRRERGLPRAAQLQRHRQHFRNFFASIQSAPPMVEDAVFGLRAGGPAVV